MEDRHGQNHQQQCAYNNEENNSQRQNNIAKEKRKGEFSIESILLAKSNQQNDNEDASNGDLNPAGMLIPPTTQSVKARAPKHPHGLHTTSLHSTHHGHGGGKRARTIFTTEQLERMEREFHKQQYVVGHERMYLANALNLTEAQVKVWFQNRRIKWRKQHMLSEQTRLHTLTDHSAAHPVNPSSHHHDPQDQLDQLN